jgi:hypothetical protein
MKDLGVESVPEKGRVLNAVALQNAVLCAECDVVSDSPHDQCLVCGSRSVFNIARMFGGNLPNERASLIASEVLEATHRENCAEFSRASLASPEGARLSRCAAS